MEDHYPTYHPCLPDGIPPKKRTICFPQIICLFRSRPDHVLAEQERRLDGVLLEPEPQAPQELPYCGEEPFDADLRHRERGEREATGPHRKWVGWDDVPHILFEKK